MATPKHRINVYGRRHIHDHVRALADWKAKKNPTYPISEEYDRLLVAGIKATYGQDIPLDVEPVTPEETPPAPAVA